MEAEATGALTRPKVHKGRGSRLTQEQLVAILKLAKLDKTQVEIAQAIGCDQGTVSRWLAQCEDSTEQAGTYLRGSALRMAQNIVKNGRAADHVAALKGVNVLADSQQSGLTVVVGGNAQDVRIAVVMRPSPLHLEAVSEGEQNR